MCISIASPTVTHQNGVIGTQIIPFVASGMTQDGMKSGVSGVIQFVGNITVTGRK